MLQQPCMTGLVLFEPAGEPALAAEPPPSECRHSGAGIRNPEPRMPNPELRTPKQAENGARPGRSPGQPSSSPGLRPTPGVLGLGQAVLGDRVQCLTRRAERFMLGRARGLGQQGRTPRPLV